MGAKSLDLSWRSPSVANKIWSTYPERHWKCSLPQGSTSLCMELLSLSFFFIECTSLLLLWPLCNGRSPPRCSAGSSQSPGPPAAPRAAQASRPERSSAACSSRSRRRRRSCRRRSARAPGCPPSGLASSEHVTTALPPRSRTSPCTRRTARWPTTGSMRGLPLARRRVWEVLDPLLKLCLSCWWVEKLLDWWNQICQLAKV